MPSFTRIVADTNVHVSRLILPESLPARALRRAELQGRMLVSDAPMYELADVLSRGKFDPYASLADRKGFVQRLAEMAEFVPIIQIIRECRDPKDDKFLEVALNGRADVIITGDRDLLVMHPWREVAITSPAEYLRR